MNPLLLGVTLGFAIGGSLGLLGGGGSILTVPALVYLVGQSPQVAVITSLAIVGTNSAMGAMFHRTQGTLDWRVALLFGGSGMVAAYFAAGWSKQLSPDLLLVSFATLMLVIGVLLIVRKTPDHAAGIQDSALWKVLLSGGVVGLLTGILGVGGGFLIVPALVMLLGLPIQKAIGTSLVVIAMNSLAGFMGHWGDAALDVTSLVVFVAAGLAGTFAGSRLAKRIPAEQLRRVFAVFVIGLAIFLLVDNVPKLF